MDMTDAGQTLANFEKAAAFMMNSSGQVSSEEYRMAEKIFLSFRRVKQPYPICKYMLENSSNAYVHFQAVSTIKEAIVREWKLTNENDKTSLREFLLNYVLGQSGCQDFVREQILSCIAIMLKRSIVTESGLKDLDNLLSNVYQMINSSSNKVHLDSCSLMSSILNEFAVNPKSSRISVSWEFHIKAKKKFESEPLKKICIIALESLQHCNRNLNQDIKVMEKYLELSEQILTWNFSELSPNRPKSGLAESSKLIAFRPGRNWDDIISNQSTIDLFLELYQKVRHESRLCHLVLSCISQLTSISNDVFPNSQSKIHYLTYLVASLVKARGRKICHGNEAQGLAEVFNRIITVDKLLKNIQDETALAFIGDLSHLTCDCLENAVKEEMESMDETFYSYAADELLESWYSIVNEDNEIFNVSRISQDIIMVFECYLKCHLSDGRKSVYPILTGNNAEIEIDELEEDDSMASGGQLLSIGALGRSILPRSLPLLSQLLENRIITLRRYISNRLSVTVDHNALMDDIHWLILIIGNVLVDEIGPELPLIPSPILHYSDHLSRSDNYVNLVKLISHICCNDSRTVNDDMLQLLHLEGIDHVLVITFLMLFIVRMEEETLRSSSADSLSPQVGKTILWFLIRWCQVYLLPREECYDHISLSLVLTFGRDSDLGAQISKFLVGKVLSNLTLWNAENDIVMETIDLLSTLVDNKARCRIVVSCEDLWNLAVQQAGNSNSSLKKLSGTAQKMLAKALVKAGSYIDDNDARDRFWSTLLGPLKNRFLAALLVPVLAKMMEDSALRNELCVTIDCCSGVALASTSSSVPALFSYLSSILRDCIQLLQRFSNVPDVVESILELFVNVVKSQIAYLNKISTNELFKLCLALMQMYTKCNVGKVSDTVFAEEEKYVELYLILRLLSQVISKDYLDFSINGGDIGQDGETIGVIDVLLCGLNFIIPLMTENLLKFPDLCLEYFKLISFQCECYPEKINEMPQNLSNLVLVSLNMALNRFGSEVNKMALESVTSLATYAYEHKRNTERNNLMIGIEGFMKSILDLLFSEDFEVDLMQSTSEALFCVICCYPDAYKNLIGNFLLAQSNAELRSYLAECFNKLIPSSLPMHMERSSKLEFRKNLRTFLADAKGVVCYR